MNPRMMLATALLSGLSLPALADSQATVTLSGFTTQLTDLNQGDGIAPHIDWNNSNANVSAVENIQHGWSTTAYPWGSVWNPVWGANINTSDASALPGTLNGTSAHGYSTQQVVNTASGLDSMTVFAHAQAGQNVSGTASQYQAFTLTAGTQATFSVVVNGSISGTSPTSGWSALPGGNYSTIDSSSIWANMYVGQVNANQGTSGSSAWPWSTDAYESTLDGQTLKLTIKNTSNADRYYQLGFYANAAASETAAPVPEPESYAMLGAGLLLVGAMARRRRQG
ncbi:PEP-CTERM sorting domain-containing protein [Duganella sp. LX20W]|uniref:PEP-CTERM sorting domain-containing protein n=1 Tax=Rugamonas brunnea TaxID=2758569 RepID=A0A7W2EQN9_9BURK|nr:PEP-CTERM sorting domain-containing protein [Rugamonas brunnea]MBA5636880.1 PEP-CTERM sorting domain-containing protein [Rugamonas brunnea]